MEFQLELQDVLLYSRSVPHKGKIHWRNIRAVISSCDLKRFAEDIFCHFGTNSSGSFGYSFGFVPRPNERKIVRYFSPLVHRLGEADFGR